MSVATVVTKHTHSSWLTTFEWLIVTKLDRVVSHPSVFFGTTLEFDDFAVRVLL